MSDVLSRLTDADILIFPCSLSLPVCQAPDCDVLLRGERGESPTINENKQTRAASDPAINRLVVVDDII